MLLSLKKVTQTGMLVRETAFLLEVHKVSRAISNSYSHALQAANHEQQAIVPRVAT